MSASKMSRGFPYEIARLAEDIAGGLMVTMASEKDMSHPEIGKVMEKYFEGLARFLHGRSLPDHAAGRKPHARHGSSRLPDGIHARRRLAAGPADHDRPAGQPGTEEETGQENRRGQRMTDSQ